MKVYKEIYIQWYLCRLIKNRKKRNTINAKSNEIDTLFHICRMKYTLK